MDSFYSNFSTYPNSNNMAATTTARPGTDLATMMRVPLPLSEGQHLSPQPLMAHTVASFEGDHTANEKVKHDYHDHAKDAAAGDFSTTTTTPTAAALLSGGPGIDQSFPMKLHFMLNDIEQDGLAHIVSWQPHGRCKSYRHSFFMCRLRCIHTVHIQTDAYSG